VSTLPPIPPAAPSIPLTPEVRAAYQALYDLYESAIEATIDPGVLQTLNASQTDVGDILTKDNMYQLHADTALFTAMQEQIKSTNDSLQTVKTQIAAIASHIALAGDIIAAIDKLLTIMPGA
jgi:hypothetical protein